MAAAKPTVALLLRPDSPVSGATADAEGPEPRPTPAEAGLLQGLTRLLSERLEAAGLRVADPGATRRACSGLTPGDEPNPDWLSGVLSFIPADRLCHGTLRLPARDGDAFQLQLRLSGQAARSAEAVDSEADHDEDREDAETRLRIDTVSVRELADALTSGLLDRLCPDDAEARRRASRIHGPSRPEALAAYGLACRARDQGDAAEARIQLARARERDPDFILPLQLEARLCQDAGDVEGELAALEQEAEGHRAAQRFGDAADAAMRLARALGSSGRTDEAIATYDRCLELWSELGEPRREAQARSNRANLILRKGDRRAAVEEYRAGLELLAAIDEARVDRTQVGYNLALALKELGEHEAALNVLGDAIPVAREIHNPGLLCRIYNARGAIQDELFETDGDSERLEAALRDYRLAEEFYEEEDDPCLLAGLRDHVAISLRKLGRFDEALAYSDKACALLERLPPGPHLAIAWLNRAGLLIELGRLEDASLLAERAGALFAACDSPHVEIVHELLSGLTSLLDPAVRGADPDFEEDPARELDALESDTLDPGLDPGITDGETAED